MDSQVRTVLIAESLERDAGFDHEGKATQSCYIHHKSFDLLVALYTIN